MNGLISERGPITDLNDDLNHGPISEQETGRLAWGTGGGGGATIEVAMSELARIGQEMGDFADD